MAIVVAVGGLLGDSLKQVAVPRGIALPDPGLDVRGAGGALVCECVYMCVSMLHMCMFVHL